MDGRRQYISTWMCNVSVALVIVGGFQENLALKWRVLSLGLAALAFIIGLILAKRGK